MKKQYQKPGAERICFCQNESIADIDIGGGSASWDAGLLPGQQSPNDKSEFQIILN